MSGIVTIHCDIGFIGSNYEVSILTYQYRRGSRGFSRFFLVSYTATSKVDGATPIPIPFSPGLPHIPKGAADFCIWGWSPLTPGGVPYCMYIIQLWWAWSGMVWKTSSALWKTWSNHLYFQKRPWYNWQDLSIVNYFQQPQILREREWPSVRGHSGLRNVTPWTPWNATSWICV